MATEAPDVPEEGSPLPEVPRDVPEEAPPPPEQPKRGRGRPRKDPSAPPKPKKQAVVDARPAQEAREAREEPRSEVDNILYLFKQREIEEQRRKSEQYRVMLGL